MFSSLRRPLAMRDAAITVNPSLAAREDAEFLRCWRNQDCKGCLDRSGCSWCPFTWSCVPNNYSIPLLAPAYDEDICPHWAERWEIRTHPLGCQVSTITSLTAIVSVTSTIVVLLLVFLLVLAAKRLAAYHRKQPDWWRIWEYSWAQGLTLHVRPKPATAREEEPLLPS
ncbi:hypothetical protein NKR23_g576 [Pleurostoma richardsiae]|uniref:PSI domain-containing protein n=1 Tax=Pleurostoma richardsiae TaxID=41990 RepID=A0AA38S717_9PEZI|nr:hypothetical protein NKR23_g576 [Pleurostoma richardsiae]